MRGAVLLFALCIGAQAAAETVVATQTIRPQQIITEADVRLDKAVVPGAHADTQDVIGQEAKVAIYPGRPVMVSAVGTPALIERNAIVELVYRRGGLVIVTEGRALARAAAGERIRVQNLASRTTLFGTVTPSGKIEVNQ